ncbi:MAG TPA: protein kinase [Vicinamibacterales bacterium]|nr:protein kinase [Vicinamibacterales bacterium]
MVGTILGHYRIERLIGTGGMGEVYLADDTRLGRHVALKVLSGEFAADPDRRERFEREARAAAALNHPNIVTIHSVEEADGVAFLTLELIDGQTLAELIPQGGLPIDRVLSLGIPLADAVGAAHQRGITHRDLKPSNVMVTSDGRLKVLDFGLAKMKEEARAAAEAMMPTAALTGDGRIVGTVAYMSPEQAEGKAVDQRSDVFSLGILLYEMATGVRPFEGDTQMSILSAILKDTPKPLSAVRQGIPRELSKIVARCLAKDVEDRYQSAKDLRNDLRALKNELTSGELEPISGSGVTAAAARPRPTRRAWIAGAAVIAVVTAIAAWWMLGSQAGNTAAPAAVRPFDTIDLTRLTTTGSAGMAAMSRDGRYVAHVSVKEGRQSLWLRQIATTSNVEIVPPDDVRYVGLSFSPDGNHIYYTTYARGGNIGLTYQVAVLGGGARLVIEDVDTSLTFSPDGSQFAFVRGYPDDGSSAIVVANVDGSDQRKLATRKRPQGFTLQGVSWSPDGRSIAATGADTTTLYGQIVLVNTADGSERILPTPEWRQVNRVAWLPDGTGLLANAQESAGESSSQIFLVQYPSGAVRRLTNDLTSYTELSVAPDGKSFVCVRNERRATIWTMPFDDPSNPVPVTTEASADDGTQGISWTPDGRLVYATEASGNPDIWIMAADGSRRVQLTSNPGQDVFPRVTYDGRYIVFVSDRDGANRIWRMGLDGSGSVRVSPDPVARARASVSSDGRWVYYSTLTGEARRVAIDGGTPEGLFDADAASRLAEPLPKDFHEPMPSPDGTFVAGHYVEAEARGERIVLVPGGGGPLRRLKTVPPSASWAPDGKSMVYIDTRGGVSNIVRQPVVGGAPVPVTRFTSEQIFGYTLSPDQKRVAVVRGRISSDVVLVK